MTNANPKQASSVSDVIQGQGMLVRVVISGESLLTAPASFAEFGIADDDPSCEWLFGGRERRVPKEVSDQVHSYISSIRNNLKEYSTELDWFKPFRFINPDGFKTWQKKHNEIVAKFDAYIARAVVGDYAEIVKWRTAIVRKSAEGSWIKMQARRSKVRGRGRPTKKKTALEVMGREFATQADFVNYVLGRASTRMPTKAKLAEELRVEFRTASFEATLQDMAAIMDEVRRRFRNDAQRILSNIEKNGGELKGKEAKLCVQLLEYYDRLAVFDDGSELRPTLEALQKFVGPVGEGRRKLKSNEKPERDIQAITKTLQQVVAVAEREMKNVTPVDDRFANVLV